MNSSEYLTKEELREKLNLPSTRMIDELMKKGKITYQKWGKRTVRFEYDKVKADLDRLERKAVGRK